MTDTDIDLPERAWLGVVSAEHATYGAAHGWIQLNHGKRTNLGRLRRGDGFVFYSPVDMFGSTTPLRAITQLGVVVDDEPYQADEMMNMGQKGTFRPWRRNVDFVPEPHRVPVRDLDLDLTRAKNWGYSLRFGLTPLTPADFGMLREVMTG